MKEIQFFLVPDLSASPRFYFKDLGACQTSKQTDKRYRRSEQPTTTMEDHGNDEVERKANAGNAKLQGNLNHYSKDSVPNRGAGRG